ncbi:hypothetical protein QE152_g30544 [Popillia japonica]|uniref:Uncharacterized protein n=1 Tax=Popillia japonica TaxID=7064 RepID=A0AAW1JDZ1_POPJA
MNFAEGARVQKLLKCGRAVFNNRPVVERRTMGPFQSVRTARRRRTLEHRHFERTLRSSDTVPGPLLAEGRFNIHDCAACNDAVAISAGLIAIRCAALSHARTLLVKVQCSAARSLSLDRPDEKLELHYARRVKVARSGVVQRRTIAIRVLAVGPVSVQIVNATSEQDSLSSGERTGTSPAPNPAAGRRTPGNVVLGRIRHLEIVRCAQVLLERGQLPIEGARPVVGRRRSREDHSSESERVQEYVKPFRGKPEKPERSKGEIQRVPDNRGESVTSDRRRSRAGGSVSVPPAAERVHFSPCRTSRPVGFRSKACGSVRWSFRSNGAANARPETFYRRYNRGEGPRLTFASGRSQVRTVNPKCGPGAASGTREPREDGRSSVAVPHSLGVSFSSREEAHQERTRWDPKDGELCLVRTKSGETLMEVRSDSDVQIDRRNWRGPGGLTWRRVSCEQPLHTSQSILSHRRKPMSMRCIFFLCLKRTTYDIGLTIKERLTPVGRKGIRFLFRNPAAEPLLSRALIQRVRRGNPKGPGDAVGRSGKSFLFCISARVPWNPLAGRYGLEREEHRSCGGVRIFPSDLENPGEGHVEASRRFVPISAAGLQGEEPLVDRIMIGSEDRGASGLVGKRVLADVPGLAEVKWRLATFADPSSVPCLGLPRNFLAARLGERFVRSPVSSSAAIQRSAQNWHGLGESGAVRPFAGVLFGRHSTIGSELARTRGIRLSN